MAEVVVSLESALTLQEKFDNSLQHAGGTIFGRMVDMISFPIKGENSAQGDSSNAKGNNTSAGHDMFLDKRELPADLKEFNFADLKRATRKFSLDMLLGEGGSGMVFLGWVDKKTFAPSRRGVGIAVAVKRFKKAITSDQGPKKWLTEVRMLSRLHNPNIIGLLGYCNDKEDEYLLVYEYMQNQSLSRFLFVTPGDQPLLSWGTRLSIMIGVARCLTYLHQLEDPIIHRDVKSSSILLDQDFNAKLADFGFARFGPKMGRTYVTTRVMGIVGYLDANYLRAGRLSMKSDIYSFGVVLLEMLTGRRALDLKRPLEQRVLVRWAYPIVAVGEVKKIIDPRLEQNYYPEEGAFKCVELAFRCLANEPKDRPPADEVLWNLEQIYAHNK